MCGIVGIVAHQPVNQMMYDALLYLQHRGQDAAGIATLEANGRFNLVKANGMVRDVFRTRDMRNLLGKSGIGHVRYPTCGSSDSEEESQPFYVNAPFGIMFATNGNLTNTDEVRNTLLHKDRRHINTNSDSEVLLNVLAHELERYVKGDEPTVDEIFDAVAALHRRIKGAYAVVAQIGTYGMLAFRDPNGIRPLCMGTRQSEEGAEWIFASESVPFVGLGFELLRDVAPGEAVFITPDYQMHSRQCAENPQLSPCLFEYVYFARPDSTIDGVSVYRARKTMGEYLARRIQEVLPEGAIDVVMPIPDTSRNSAMQTAAILGLPYREGFVKNRYIGRTFIMPGQAVRKKSVRQKLNVMPDEFQGKNVLLIDDSIVRGTTSREIVEMARESGANKVYFASAAPPVRYPNVYGIDMPTQKDLIAYGKEEAEIAREIGADGVIYQRLEDLEACVRKYNPEIKHFEASCFDGCYVTGDVDEAFLEVWGQKR